MQKNSREQQISNKNNANFLKLLFTSILGVIFLIALLFSASAIILKNDFKGTSIIAIAFVCCILSGFLTGFITARRIKTSGLLFGLLSSVPICLTILILTTLVADSLGKNLILACVATMLASSTGGILAVNFKRKIKY